MARQPSIKLQKAIEKVIAGETPYAAAKACGVHLTTIYRSQLYKDLIAKRLSEHLLDRRKRLSDESKEIAIAPRRPYIPRSHDSREIERENYELLGCLLMMVGASNTCINKLALDRRQNENLAVIKQVVLDAESLLRRILDGQAPETEAPGKTD